MKYFHYKSITSTNDFAKELIKDYNEVIVTADYQSSGRGRNGNKWEGAQGQNLLMSIGLNHDPQLDVEHASIYQAIGPIAVKNALSYLTGYNKIVLKYPNDILAIHNGSYKKISGILVENGYFGSSCSYTILGIGVNINQERFPFELMDTAVSLRNLGFSCELTDLTAVIINEFIKVRSMSILNIFDLWVKEMNIEGKSARINGDSDTWIIKNLMSDCRLVLTNSRTGAERIIDNGDSIRYSYE